MRTAIATGAQPLVLSLVPPLVLALAAGCPEAPPLSLTVEPATLAADGLTRAVVIARTRDPIEGAVVSFAATGGALSSSTAALVDGEATVELVAPLERELGRSPERAIALSAFLQLSESERLEATAGVVALPPTDGPPLLFLDAEPPAAVAGSGGAVVLRVLARRVAAGASLTIDVPGFDADASATVEADGSAVAALQVPATPGDATVTVTEPASGATALVVVRFVAEGEPLYDLTGAFAQIGPARVKLVSGALAPNPQCAIAPSIILATFVQAGLDVQASYRTCDVTFPPVTSIVGTITNQATEAFYQAIPVVEQQFALPNGELGAEYAPPPSIVVVGAALGDPEHEALPTEAEDPRVEDTDGDGRPGVTVENSLGGLQNIVFRNIGYAGGQVRSSNRIVGDRPGDLLATTETSVFGIGGAFLPDTTALGSVVELVRIDGRFGAWDADVDADGAISCAEAKDAAAAVAELVAPDTPFDCGEER
ncbi:MAG: Ig-like domain-containing protein [Deltaproteobacteria bacterium]|nr:Ig-like domain-containing protein [Deltaproteobacteria bacterium]